MRGGAGEGAEVAGACGEEDALSESGDLLGGLVEGVRGKGVWRECEGWPFPADEGDGEGVGNAAELRLDPEGEGVGGIDEEMRAEAVDQ